MLEREDLPRRGNLALPGAGKLRGPESQWGHGGPPRDGALSSAPAAVRLCGGSEAAVWGCASGLQDTLTCGGRSEPRDSTPPAPAPTPGNRHSTLHLCQVGLSGSKQATLPSVGASLLGFSPLHNARGVHPPCCKRQGSLPSHGVCVGGGACLCDVFTHLTHTRCPRAPASAR